MQFSSYLVVTLIMFLFTIVSLCLSLKYKSKPAATELFWALLLLGIGVIFFIASLIVRDGSLKLYLHEMKFLGIPMLSTQTLVVYMKFTENDHLIKPKFRLALYLFPALTTIVALTNPLHHLFRQELSVITVNNVTYVNVSNGIWFFFHTAYSYSLVLAGLIFVLINYYKKPKLYRGQTSILVSSSLIIIAVSISSILGVYNDYGDVSLLSMAFASILQCYALILYKPKGMLQTARNMALSDIVNQIMIFDNCLRLVDANKSAIETFELRPSEFNLLLLDDFLQKKLPIVADITFSNSDDGYQDAEIFLRNDGHYFSLNDKSLYDSKNKFVGRLLVFNNITTIRLSVNELEQVASSDYQTGLLNRQAVSAKLSELNQLEFPTTCVVLSINGLSQMLDIFGFEYIDQLVMYMAQAVAQNNAGVSAHLFKGEFLAILKSSDELAASEYVERVRDVVKEYEGRGFFIDFTWAMEVLYAPIQDTDGLLNRLLAEISVKRKELSADGFVFNTLNNSLMLHGITSPQLSNDLAELCTKTAIKLGVGDVNRIPLLASMHDLGLLGLSKETLQTLGNLSNEEWEEVRKHPLKAHRIAVASPQLKSISEEILTHHERFDGFGYPSRIKGEDIPILSRILSIAEFYLNNSTTPGIVEKIQKRSGTHFDPAVVDAFCAVVETESL